MVKEGAQGFALTLWGAHSRPDLHRCGVDPCRGTYCAPDFRGLVEIRRLASPVAPSRTPVESWMGVVPASAPDLRGCGRPLCAFSVPRPRPERHDAACRRSAIDNHMRKTCKFAQHLISKLKNMSLAEVGVTPKIVGIAQWLVSRP